MKASERKEVNKLVVLPIKIKEKEKGWEFNITKRARGEKRDTFK